MTPEILELRQRSGNAVQCIGEFDRQAKYVVHCLNPKYEFTISGPMDDNRLPCNWAEIVNSAQSIVTDHDFTPATISRITRLI